MKKPMHILKTPLLIWSRHGVLYLKGFRSKADLMQPCNLIDQF